MANSTGAWVSPSTLTRAAFFALAYYLGARAGLALVVQPDNISVLWPANAVAVALVLLSPPFMWPAFLLALISGHLLAVAPAANLPLPAVLGLGVGGAIEVFLAAWLMRRFVGGSFTFTRVRDVLGLVAFAAGVSCTFSGLFAAVVITASIPGVPYWAVWISRAVGTGVAQSAHQCPRLGAQDDGLGRVRER